MKMVWGERLLSEPFREQKVKSVGTRIFWRQFSRWRLWSNFLSRKRMATEEITYCEFNRNEEMSEGHGIRHWSRASRRSINYRAGRKATGTSEGCLETHLNLGCLNDRQPVKTRRVLSSVPSPTSFVAFAVVLAPWSCEACSWKEDGSSNALSCWRSENNLMSTLSGEGHKLANKHKDSDALILALAFLERRFYHVFFLQFVTLRPPNTVDESCYLLSPY